MKHTIIGIGLALAIALVGIGCGQRVAPATTTSASEDTRSTDPSNGDFFCTVSAHERRNGRRPSVGGNSNLAVATSSLLETEAVCFPEICEEIGGTLATNNEWAFCRLPTVGSAIRVQFRNDRPVQVVLNAPRERAALLLRQAIEDLGVPARVGNSSAVWPYGHGGVAVLRAREDEVVFRLITPLGVDLITDVGAATEIRPALLQTQQALTD